MSHCPRFCAAAIAGILSLHLMASARGDASSGELLVVNKGNGTLSVVDAATCRQVAAIAENGRTGHEVAVSPDGRRAYVPIYSSAGVGQPGTDGSLIRVVDLATRTIVGTVDFGRGIRPHRPVFGPRDGLLYVTTEIEQSVSIIDPVSLKVVGLIPTGHLQSHMLAISSDGKLGYTANVSSGTVSVLDIPGRRLVTSIPVATIVQRISLSTDDRWAFTADETKLRLVVIDTSTNSVSRSIPLPGLAFGTTPTPDGRWLLVAMPAIRMVGLVDLHSMKVVRTLDVPKAPQEIVVRPDGAVAYVSCDSSEKVAVINLRTWAVDCLIDVGPADDGLAWVPGA
jgi:DNA-binding beta-propeller fold protein YncE